MRTLQIFVFALVFVATFHLSFGRKLPAYFKSCKYSTDKVELGECMRKIYKENEKLFLNGIPEWHIPPYDPFFLEKIEFQTGNNNNAMSLTMQFTNLTLYGTKDMVVEKIEFDMENAVATGETRIPHLYATTDYQIKGNILVLPLDSAGKAVLNLTEVHTTDKYTGKKYTKKGKEHIRFEGANCDVSIKGLHVYFDNLINGNPTLTKSTNDVFNENAEALIEELQLVMSKTFISLRLYILNALFTRYSIDELLDRN